jgi:hypothetical protein
MLNMISNIYFLNDFFNFLVVYSSMPQATSIFSLPVIFAHVYMFVNVWAYKFFNNTTTLANDIIIRFEGVGHDAY